MNFTTVLPRCRYATPGQDGPVDPGVYRVGHTAPSVEATYLAAVWACGEGALLMGLSAAFLYGLIKGRPPKPVVKTRTERRITGIEEVLTRHHPVGAAREPRDQLVRPVLVSHNDT